MKIYIHSIRFQLILIFGMLSVIISSMILTLTYNQEQNIRTFSRMSEESLRLSRLPVKIGAIDHLLDLYQSIEEKEFFESYENSYSEISEIMATLAPPPDGEIPNIRPTHYHELDKVITAFNTMKRSVPRWGERRDPPA